MALPIVFIHQGNSFYLPYAFIQARIYNPDSRIILIGDEGNRHYSRLVEHVYLKDYFQTAQQLAQVYVHESTNGHDYELFCLQRWFVLLDFMKAQGLDSSLYLDSDVLSYANFTDEVPSLPPLEMSICLKSPHTNFILNRDRLSSFCRFIMNGYTGPMAGMMRQMWLAEHYAQNGRVGGISDMTFFMYYRQEEPEKVADLSLPWQGRVADLTIDYHQEFEMQGGLKKISFKPGPGGLNQPYAQPSNGGLPVRLITLHFQGGSKASITHYLQGWQSRHHNQLPYFKRKLWLQKLQAKIRSLFN